MKHRTATKYITILLVLIVSILLASCATAADIASQNLSKSADNFEINRRVVFYNGFTGTYIRVIEGRCSLGNYDETREVSITCKTGPNEYYKYFLGLSDNVTYFVDQLAPMDANTYNFRLIVRPEQIIPYLELDTSAKK